MQRLDRPFAVIDASCGQWSEPGVGVAGEQNPPTVVVVDGRTDAGSSHR
jgi:hypothetical protein